MVGQAPSQNSAAPSDLCVYEPAVSEQGANLLKMYMVPMVTRCWVAEKLEPRPKKEKGEFRFLSLLAGAIRWTCTQSARMWIAPPRNWQLSQRRRQAEWGLGV